jgi:hypothetical protein
MSRALALAVLAACGSSQPSPQSAAPAAPPPVPADAAVDAPPDAGPEFASAPPWVFRYHTADRSETWTLRHVGGAAELVVATAQGERRYVGTATETAGALAIDVTSSNAKLALDCKREKLAVSAKCNDRKAKPIDVLSCYHKDFKTPMPFAPAPGVEYVVDATCNGYRLAAP